MKKSLKILLIILIALAIVFVVWLLLKKPELPPPLNGIIDIWEDW